MAKTKPTIRSSSKSTLLHAPRPPRPRKSKPPPSPAGLLAEASSLLISSSPSEALPLALRALSLLQPFTTAALPALNLVAQIQLELGDGDAARTYFQKAVDLDADGEIAESEGGGAEKFLWLAQLSEEGGRESVEWFERGCDVLRRQIGNLEKLILESSSTSERAEMAVNVKEKKCRLAEALCGVVEIFMTDLSLESDAEVQCERLIMEALSVAPDSPEPLQTLASVRISQSRTEDAREALAKSVDLWKDIELGDEDLGSQIPDFPTRISLARLLMEVSMLEEALVVLDRLVGEDDQSIEAWYLGGWCLYISAEINMQEKGEERSAALQSSRQWLQESLRLYNVLEYEDERLREHAMELVTDLDRELGPGNEDEAQEDGADGVWEDEDDDEDGGEQDDEDEDQKMSEA